jgi:molybdopterin-containing oxidoreductase family iron-sulfur binding subunit
VTKRRLPILSDAAAGSPDDPLEAEASARHQQSRRTFLGAMGAAGATAAVAASGCGGPTLDSVFQQHYHRLTEADRREVFARLEAEVLERDGVRAHIRDPQAIPGVEYAFALSLTACTGCRQCEYACAEENNTSRDPQIHYIRIVEMDIGSFDLDESEHDYEGLVPADGKVYMPVACQQCANPPCVAACPVNATWREDDGIVVIDYDWCIGCRYCMAACPYGARHFNFAPPAIRPSEINPDQGYLSNRARKVGVMEKCHFCLHRTRRGQLPACQEACPVGARKFGNLLDPHSEVRQILETKRVYILKEELGTMPRFYYYFG